MWSANTSTKQEMKNGSSKGVDIFYVRIISVSGADVPGHMEWMATEHAM